MMQEASYIRQEIYGSLQTLSLLLYIIAGKTITDFQVDDNEKDRADQFTQQAFDYISDRIRKTDTRGLQEYPRLEKGVSGQGKNTYRYFNILDTVSESKDTLQTALAKNSTRSSNWWLQMRKDIHSYKHEDPDTFSWLIPFPGDFHLHISHLLYTQYIWRQVGFNCDILPP